MRNQKKYISYTLLILCVVGLGMSSRLPYFDWLHNIVDERVAEGDNSAIFLESEEKSESIKEEPNKSLATLSPNSETRLKLKGFEGYFPKNSVKQALKISVTTLDNSKLPELPANIVNITKEVDGYQLLPKKIKLEKDLSLNIQYDKTKIPEGFTEQDVDIFFFDYEQSLWKKLHKDSVQIAGSVVKARTNYFSDFIAGIIKLPESPDTSGFTPTSISGLKAASPLIGIQPIATPSSNSEGTASTSFSIELPQGRAGMQPSIQLQYSDGGGYSWVGTDWFLSIPSLSIDTRWGAPRYDEQKETESYILSGEELLPNAHRGEWKDRVSNQYFYPRREGAFQQIQRLGSSPKEYKWVVKSKNGITSYYGSDEYYQLKDTNGNIGYWALKEQKDLKGNSIQYHYVKDKGVLYPKSIYYTGYGNESGAYSVHFITDRELGEPQRKDLQISARLGFRQEYNRLLRRIEVKYKEQNVRSYELIYEEGAFRKPLLKEIKTYDAEDNLFYSNKMDYYDDIRDASGNYQPFGEFKKWEVPKDNIEYTFLGIDGFSGHPTLVGTSSSESKGFSFRAGVGIIKGMFKDNTIGGNGGSSWGETKSKVFLQDIDGDNLPDKVYTKGSSVYYRKNLTAQGESRFAEEVKINLSTAGVTKSNSYNYGVDLQAYGKASIGYDRKVSKSKTQSYFMDFNGDGLVDFVNNGRVYYNRLVDGKPTFLLSSGGTPSPIVSSSNDLEIEGDTSITEEELIEHNPLHDVVRTWKAPKDGLITLKHSYQLQKVISEDRFNYKLNDGTEKADGVVLYFQKANKLLWKEEIDSEDYNLKHKEEEITVKKGEVLYFRVSSKYDGNFDKTLWRQEIIYKDISEGSKDYNGLDLKHYAAQKDEVYSSDLVHGFAKPTAVKLKGTFEKKATIDLVKLKVYKQSINNAEGVVIYQKTFKGPEEVSFDLSAINLPNFDIEQAIKLEIESPTQIDWSQIKINPELTYTDEADQEKTERLNVSFSIYEKIDRYYEPNYYTIGNNYNSIAFDLNKYTFNGFYDGTGEVIFTIKQDQKVAVRNTYKVSGSSITLLSEATEGVEKDKLEADKPIYIEAVFSDPKLYTLFNQANIKVRIIKDNGFQEDIYDKYASYVLYKGKNKNMKFGKAYRGWGSFILNGNLAGDIIDESKLVETKGNYSDEEGGEPDMDTDLENEDTGLEVSKIYFVQTNTDYNEKRHFGIEPDIFLEKDMFYVSRLGENDLAQYLDTTLPTLEGGTSRALTMVSESRSHSYSAGVTIVQGASGSASKSEGESEVKETMADFNGDRFPDFVRGGSVQFTEPRGGIESRTMELGRSFSYSKTQSFGPTLNGAFVHGEAKSSLFYSVIPSKQQKDNVTKASIGEADKAKNSMSVNGSYTNSDDYSKHAYFDINGDGLADYITSNGSVSYNTGYGFLPAENWENFGGLSSGSSKDISAGLGYSMWNGSFSGGLNYNSSTSKNEVQHLDFNGDGLVDRVQYLENETLIYLNLGNTWDTTPIRIDTQGNPIAVNKSISYGGSVNASYPIYLLFIKLVFTAGGNAGKSTNRVEATLMDVDGDGNLDYVLSDAEDDLRVALSNIRRTNKLKRIENSTGTTYDIDYEWIAPTYDNPHSRWVLKTVKAFDGHEGDGEDYTQIRYTYKKPYYDRRERSFYGFEQVKQEQLNPKDESVLRSSVQNYYNRDYFRHSLLKNSYSLDRYGNKITESTAIYKITNAQTGEEIAPGDLVLPNTDAVSVFVAPVESTERQYENSDYLEHKTTQSYDNSGNIISYKDYGNGDSSSEISAEITYYNSTNPYYGGIAKSIVVKDENGVVRKRETSINPSTAEITQIRQYIDAQTVARTDLSYDVYGNLERVTGAENAKGQRGNLVYEYDGETHSHITKITDHFGYQNTMAYDYRFNVPIFTTDRNGESMSYTIDAKGRTTSILAPKEAKVGKPYTVAYEYHPEAEVPYAKTKNYDAEHNADILTYTYTDGLGRGLQVKKTASLFQGKGMADAERFIVSGKQIYDALGRVVESYYPIIESPSEAFNNGVSTVSPTLSEYDEKDRVIKQTLADGTTIKMAYDIASLNGLKMMKTQTTDALDRTAESYVDVLGRTYKQVQPTGIETTYQYNALGEIIKVTDAEGHTTTSRYDLLGRRVELVHPDAGTTTMVYDKASNLIQRQTSQIREVTPNGFISYEYDYNRLREIKYPHNPENNVRYHYGKQEESPSRRGRLWLVEDASGGAEYFYGDMGEVEKEIRTIRITPTETQTYVSEYSYDSWNRIQQMVYPDGEVLDFEYNRAGQLNRMTGKKGQYHYTYLKQQGYDEFEQKVYRHYGNDTETHYSYDPVMRRLSTLESHSDKQQFQNNHYNYDLVGNILKVENSVQVGNTLGGASVYQYQYDELNRLIKAEGSYTGFENKANYSLTMQYNNLNGIVQKALSHKLNDQEKGYTLNYEYNNTNHPHAPSSIKELTQPEARSYEYDGNGNPTSYQGNKDFRVMAWDEENRLRGINDNGKLHLYTYDHTGERVLKSSNESQQIIINGINSAIINHSENYTAYVSPYFVVNKGKFTKHYFEGSTRIASKLGEGTFVHQNRGITAGSIDYIAQSAAQQEAIDNYIRTLKVPPGPPTQQGIFGSPEYTGVPYPSVEWQEISQDQEPPEGWPRPPKFNEPGDVPGPPVQYGDPITPENAEGGLSFIDNGVEENNLYFYHPDHLGSSSYITDKEGNIIQHTEYMAFGEVLFDEHSVSTTMPYLFNAKELDSETGLYYYGARYYDAKTSLWLNTDPLSGYNPIQEIEHYIDGQHNGGIYNPMNMATYSYTYQNPVIYVDPNGKQSKFWTRFWGGAQMFGGALEVAGSGVGEYFSGGTATPLMVPLFLNGVDNFQAGARQLWTGEQKNTLLYTGTELGAKKLGASDENAQRIATGVDLSTIFVGGVGSVKNIKNVKNVNKIVSGTERVTNVVPRTKDVLGHIFRDAPGHVNPSTVASQDRYIKLFENVANNSKNINANVLTNYQRTAGGFQGYSQTFRNGNQVWVQTRNGKIINAGVNIIPK